MSTVLKGREDVGRIGQEYYSGKTAEILELISASNDVEVQGGVVFNAFAEMIEKSVDRRKGSKIPVKRFNVYFKEGGIETSAPEMRQYIDTFTVRRTMGYNVMAFDYSEDDIVNAEIDGIDLNARETERVAEVTRVYMNRYLPYARMLALITGSTLTTTIPSTNDGGNYISAFGWVRGEDCSDFLPPTQANKGFNRNHYRTAKNTTTGAVTADDIKDLTRSIKNFNDYSNQGIVAICNPETRDDLSLLYNRDENVDDEFIKGMQFPKFLSCTWVETEVMSEEFIIFLDKGKMNILLRCQEPVEKYKGMGLYFKEDNATFKSVEQASGAKLRIFPEEWIVAQRHAGGILDVSGVVSRAHASGFMQSASETALNTYAGVLKGGYDIQAQ